MGVLNTAVYNARAYGQHVQAVSLPSNIELLMSTPAVVGLFNVLPYNSAPFNSGTPVVTIAGAVTISVALNKGMAISNVPSAALGVFNSVPHNSYALNGATGVSNGGSGTMSATLGSSVVSITAGIAGSALVGGPNEEEGVSSYNGGYNSAAYLDGPYNDAYHMVLSPPSEEGVDLTMSTLGVSASIAGLGGMVMLLDQGLLSEAFNVLLVVPDPLEVRLIRQ